MIAVNVGDVVEVRGLEGQWTLLYSGSATDQETGEVRYRFYGTPVDEPDRNETRFWWADITRNVTADKAKAAAEKKTAGCKFWYATRLNDAAVELGAETLPELYALMAAAGVKFAPGRAAGSYAERAKEGVDPADRDAVEKYMTDVEAKTKLLGLRSPKSVYDTYIGGGNPPGSIPPRTTMFVADEAQPVGATFDWNAFLKPSGEPTDTDPDQPTVVGS